MSDLTGNHKPRFLTRIALALTLITSAIASSSTSAAAEYMTEMTPWPLPMITKEALKAREAEARRLARESRGWARDKKAKHPDPVASGESPTGERTPHPEWRTAPGASDDE